MNDYTWYAGKPLFREKVTEADVCLGIEEIRAWVVGGYDLGGHWRALPKGERGLVDRRKG